MEAMLQNMHNPAYRDNIGGKVEELKKDPEIAGILEEIQQGGPAAMMKYADLTHLHLRPTCSRNALCKHEIGLTYVSVTPD